MRHRKLPVVCSPSLRHAMAAEESVFKYKLDFHYQSALIYLITLIVYGGIRGNFVEQKFEYVLNDPLMYVIIFFVLMAFVMLVVTALRNRRLVLTHDALIFRHRWAERRINIADIEWMHIGRETGVRTGGRSQAIIFKVKNKRRLMRIRVGRYERERELMKDMRAIATRVPGRNKRLWRGRRIMDR
jgi:hypothetical protein